MSSPIVLHMLLSVKLFILKISMFFLVCILSNVCVIFKLLMSRRFSSKERPPFQNIIKINLRSVLRHLYVQFDVPGDVAVNFPVSQSIPKCLSNSCITAGTDITLNCIVTTNKIKVLVLLIKMFGIVFESFRMSACLKHHFLLKFL